MKKTIILFVILVLSLVNEPLYACTGLYYADDNVVLAASNLDWFDPVTKIWYRPAEEDNYGVIYFGADGSPLFGMNEKGLFFQRFMNSYLKVTESLDKPFCERPLFHKIMQECATVEEATAILSQYNLKELERAKMFFGDLQGQSMIVEGDDIIKKQGSFQICRALLTNAALGKPGYQNDIYQKAKSMIEGKTAIVELFRDALQEVRAENEMPTVCSGVFDLKNGIISLYCYHDFDNVYTINFEDALREGKRTVEIPDLFPGNDKANKHNLLMAERVLPVLFVPMVDTTGKVY